MDNKIQLLIQKYQKIFNHRDSRLFTEFLVKGYKDTTLSSADEDKIDDVLYAKFCLGTIITIYDDLADNPSFYNPKLLKDLYRLNLMDVYYPDQISPTHDLVIHLFREMRETLARFPRYNEFRDVLNFDIKHVFLANQYSEMMTARPSIRNLSEGKLFGPYNMGMVAAGMIDLMASSDLTIQELGKMREIFIDGQRVGRIGNLLATYKREKGEGDVTNEMFFHPMGIEIAMTELMDELEEKLTKLSNRILDVKTFDIKSYVSGLNDLFRLHTVMEGII
ncbi:isoprenoid biosynthesis enzyme family protein [Peredibacter starrii]|uniref:Phytoene synthase n=1 Tax=Peredibacter starrii TaxID=28202 RepID=A0AAX4HK28_9BACT|nr:hypothetical protein [Peredibacter starrii]WPU63559.1 hypothetical protein SOO65_12755 [Peredibacter starrii]